MSIKPIARIAALSAVSASVAVTALAGTAPASAKEADWSCPRDRYCAYEGQAGTGWIHTYPKYTVQCDNLGARGHGDAISSFNKVWTGLSMELLNWNGSGWTVFFYRGPNETGNWDITGALNNTIDAISIGGSRACA
ncbi:hypothetical protein ACJWDR_44480 [Streptomyces tauricus]|uniref:hypothetical protein n=1 Tax=Streptomyces tauricus TaxID=68274 RepID=UPI00387F2129